jgi:ricin-type beta-trefoil lectin protein/glycosyl hydrolase family 18 (putative chitinase)
MRITRTRALLAAALPLAAGAVFFVATPSATAAGAAFPAHFAAPYLQISGGDAGDMAQDMASSGVKFYTLAFLTPSSGCNMVFEADGGGPATFVNQIRSLQAAGGNVAISFGGAAGGEVAQTCTNTASLTAAYANVINSNGIQRLDFDIEGSVLGDTASTARRDSALAALQAQNPAVQVDFTLAVAPNGLPSQEMGLLQDAKNKGVRVSTVNIMTMDFGNGQNALNDAESAANATSGQLAGLYGISTAAAFNMMGLTPIAGQNDDNEFFSQANASTLESFAASKGVGELSFWEVDAFDKPVGFNYSRIFNAIGGGGTPPPPPPPNGKQITGIGGKCVDVAGANPADGTQVQIFTCNGTAAQSWTHTGSTYQALGKCLDVAAAGTANGTKVQLFTCNGTGAQSWTHTASNQLVNANSGKCLDATGVSSADGTPLQIWTCSGGTNQAWVGP